MTRADRDYDRFLAECARLCGCCQACGDVPCPGVTAGGLCDDVSCICDDDFEAGYDDDDDPEWW